MVVAARVWWWLQGRAIGSRDRLGPFCGCGRNVYEFGAQSRALSGSRSRSNLGRCKGVMSRFDGRFPDSKGSLERRLVFFGRAGNVKHPCWL